MKRISRNVTFLGIVSGLTDISSEMLYPIIPLFLTVTLGAPMSVVGFIEGLAEALASLFKIAGGWISDWTRRRKPFVVLGYTLSAVGKPILALAATWHLVLFARFIDRLGKGVRTAPRDALIADSTSDDDRGLAFGFHRAMDTAGAAIGPIFSILLIRYFGFSYRRLFVTAFVPAVLGVLVLSAFVKEEVPEISSPLTPEGKNFGMFSKEFKRLLWIYGLFSLGNSSDIFLLMRAKSAGFSVMRVLSAYVLYNGVYALASTPTGRISDRIGRERTLAAGLGVFALVYLGFAFTVSPAALWILFTIYGLYSAMTDGIAKALVADLSDSPNRGSAMGAFQGLTGILAFFASAAAGLLWTHLSPQAPFLLGAAAAGLSAILLLTFF